MAWQQVLEWHLRYTDSARAGEVLNNWKTMLPKFVKVMPTAYRGVLEAHNQKQPKEVEAVLHG